MTDASAAGRELARRRWGRARVDTLIRDLSTRAEQIDDDQAERLRALLAETEKASSA